MRVQRRWLTEAKTQGGLTQTTLATEERGGEAGSRGRSRRLFSLYLRNKKQLSDKVRSEPKTHDPQRFEAMNLGTIERRSGWQGAPSQQTAFSKIPHRECLDTLNRAKRFPNHLNDHYHASLLLILLSAFQRSYSVFSGVDTKYAVSSPVAIHPLSINTHI